MPPVTRPPTAREIRIEDVDGGVLQFFDRVMDAHVSSPDGSRRKVPVKFGVGERWVAAADRQGIRDRDGRLILPVIQVRRTDLDPGNNRTALAANTPKLSVARLIDPKTAALANLDNSRPISTRRLRDGAVFDIYSVPFPSTVNLAYKVRIQAQYQFQMNEIIEKLLSRLEFHSVPTFIVSLADDVRGHGIAQGNGSTELEPQAHSEYDSRLPRKDYYCVGQIDGSLGEEGNQDEFTDQERIIQTSFVFKISTALMLNPEGDPPAVTRTRAAFSVSLSEEQVHVVEDPADADRIFGRQK